MTSQKNNFPTLAFGAIIGALASVLIGILRLFSKNPPKDEGESKAQSLSSEKKPIVDSQVENTREAVSHPTKEDPSAWSLTTKYIVGTGLFVALLGLVFLSSSAIPLIIFAAIMAFLVQPVILFFEKHFKMSRSIAAFVTYFLVLVILISLPIIFVPALLDAVNFTLNIDYQVVLENLTAWVGNMAHTVGNIPVVKVLFAPGLDALSDMLQGIPTMKVPAPVSLEDSITTLGDRLAKAAGVLATIFGPIISSFVSFFFMLMISLYMSLSSEKLLDGFTKIFPSAYKDEWTGLLDRLGDIWASFLRAQLTLMFAIGVMVWIGNLILGTPQALFLGVLAGALEVIPTLGPILAAVPAVILAFIFGSQYFAIAPWVFALIVIAFYVLIQLLENQLVAPKILGEALELPPLIVLLGVFIGGALFGVLGIFLSTPVISSGREIFMYLYGKILETPPVKKETSDDEKVSWKDKFRGMMAKVGFSSRG